MDTAKRLYEALFLVDTAVATADWDGTMKAIERLLERAQADVLSVRKWDEKKLAYPVKKKERGTYLLAYFKAPTSSMAGLERDVQLSETVMRVMVLRGDHLTAEDMQKETPATAAQVAVEAAASEAKAEEAAPVETESADI